MTARIILKSGKERTVLSKHPWVFSGAIKQIDGNPVAGDLVEVCDNHGTLLGSGTYGTGSIAVRLLSFDAKPIDDDYWRLSIARAIQLRKNLNISTLKDLNAFRLIHGEGDQIPGLIADYYNGVVVLQFHHYGIYKFRDIILEHLLKSMGDTVTAVYDKSAHTLHHNDAHHHDHWCYGQPMSEVEICEYGMKMQIGIEEGQKTGFFIDQRENRQMLRQMSQRRKVLNAFSYTGGFSVAAAFGHALEIHSLDSSVSAMAMCEKNMALNGFADHTSVTADAFDYLKNMDDSFDLVVLDPPAFAKHVNTLSKGIKGYQNINKYALEKIKSGGLLFTFSCSQVVSKEDFRKAVFMAAAQTQRRIKVIAQLGQPADHPIDLFHPQGEYLKGLVLYVD